MLRKIINFKKVGTIGKSNIGYFLTTIINQAIPFLFLPILTRYLSVEEYGQLAIFNVCIAFANSILGNTSVHYISKHFYTSSKDENATRITNVILLIFGLFFISEVILLICYFILKSTNISTIQWWLFVVPVVSLGFNCLQIGLTILKNENKIAKYSIHQITNTVLNIGFSLLLIVIFIMSWKGRIIGICISNIFSALFIIFYLKRNGFWLLKFSKRIMKEIFEVIIPLTPNSLQTILLIQGGVFIINIYYSKELAGLYSVALQLSLLIRILADTLNLSWSPYIYKSISQNENITHFGKFILIQIVILLIGTSVLVFLSRYILKFMTTKEFYDAYLFVPWLATGFFFYGAFLFFVPILVYHNKQKIIRKNTFITLIVSIISLFVFTQLYGFIGVAITLSVSFGVLFLLGFYYSQKTCRISFF